MPRGWLPAPRSRGRSCALGGAEKGHAPKAGRDCRCGPRDGRSPPLTHAVGGSPTRLTDQGRWARRGPHCRRGERFALGRRTPSAALSEVGGGLRGQVHLVPKAAPNAGEGTSWSVFQMLLRPVRRKTWAQGPRAGVVWRGLPRSLGPMLVLPALRAGVEVKPEPSPSVLLGAGTVPGNAAARQVLCPWCSGEPPGTLLPAPDEGARSRRQLSTQFGGPLGGSRVASAAWTSSGELSCR